MSSMTKYLRQQCSFEQLVRDEKGDPLLDKYGEKTYQDSVVLRCRRQKESTTVSTADGLLLVVGTSYHLDEKLEPHVGDRIDGDEIVAITNYVHGSGKCLGYRCYV